MDVVLQKEKVASSLQPLVTKYIRQCAVLMQCTGELSSRLPNLWGWKGAEIPPSAAGHKQSQFSSPRAQLYYLFPQVSPQGLGDYEHCLPVWKAEPCYTYPEHGILLDLRKSLSWDHTVHCLHTERTILDSCHTSIFHKTSCLFNFRRIFWI